VGHREDAYSAVSTESSARDRETGHNGLMELQFQFCSPTEEPANSFLRAAEDHLTQLYGAPDSTLPREVFSPPEGGYLIGWERDVPIAGGGFTRHDSITAEIRRMYVRPEERGRGVARLLLGAVESAVRAAGYARAILDTGPQQPHAEALYRSAGYVDIENFRKGKSRASFWGEKTLMVEEPLAGGVAHAGAVTRAGDYVLRPSGPFSETLLMFLSALRGVGFEGIPEPVGVDEDGRERLVYIPGDVALAPYPLWAQSDDALASITRLIRRFHDASRLVDPSDQAWSEELSDPNGGKLVCHNDVCLENIVFNRGNAIALLDFDFAAPGRPVWDLARFASMCVPVDDEASATRLGWQPADRAGRLRLVADTYGLDSTQRNELLSILDHLVAQSGQWVLSKVNAGDPNFTKMWNELGGMERHTRRRQWWSTYRSRVADALR
jgi:GNAT superfamily N-acetyltransferase